MCVGEGWNWALGAQCGMSQVEPAAQTGLGYQFQHQSFLYTGMRACKRSEQGADHQMPARKRVRTTSGSGGDRQDGAGSGKTEYI